MDGKTLTCDSDISIIGEQIDSRLTFTDHVRGLARSAARKLACVRRIAPLLDAKVCCTLYHSQVRSVIEYCPLVWSCCPPSYLGLLDKVQKRAQRLVSFKRPVEDRQLHFQPLQHRRDILALCVLYTSNTSLLMSLRPEPRAAPLHSNTTL
ncbi:uncharacterized protein LOC134768888 [Penaeus indicus]|uniref:uncharacterized protein LOC134768888 n=1 Tax=Penaeus indicus TaxID=29960 RepID=UPI00300CC8DD